jgi:hypothetical protein
MFQRRRFRLFRPPPLGLQRAPESLRRYNKRSADNQAITCLSQSGGSPTSNFTVREAVPMQGIYFWGVGCEVTPPRFALLAGLRGDIRGYSGVLVGRADSREVADG